MPAMLRWRVACLVSAAIAISYLDRQTLPVAIQAIERDIPVSNEQFSFLQSSFLVSYALMYAGGGRLVDVLGTRTGFLIIMVFWSLACASHGLAASVGMLAVSRFLLGLGEGGGFPAATRAVAEWFPVHERSTAMGIINAGTAVGGIVSAPLIALVLSTSDWRTVFFLTGAIGLAWTVWWWRDYSAPAATDAFEAPRPPWGGLLRIQEVWGLVIAKFLSDAAWYFYLFWLPRYLYDARGFDIKAVGAVAGLVGFGGAMGGVVFGQVVGYLLDHQFGYGVVFALAGSFHVFAFGVICLLVPNILPLSRSSTRTG